MNPFKNELYDELLIIIYLVEPEFERMPIKFNNLNQKNSDFDINIDKNMISARH